MCKILTIPELRQETEYYRRKVLEMAVRANSGHVSTAMSQCEILTSLYFGGHLRYRPEDPKWEGRDVFLLSKGQGGIGFYVTLARAGYFPEALLDNFCGEGSTLGVHSEMHTPGSEILSGSLGHGLPIATGIAKAFKNDGKDNLVFVLTGDGELHEGSNWEAMMSASWLKLDNLVVIVDRNGQATLGKTDNNVSAKDGPGLEPLLDKFEAFGFNVIETDGHSLEDLQHEFSYVRENATKGGKPWVIIATTKKGKGLSCMEDKRLWHYKVPSGKDLDLCWDELNVLKEERVPEVNTSQVKHGKAMRDSFFDSLYEHFKQDKKMVLITADNGFPTIEKWAETLPGQVIQVGIAEQQAVGMAAGMAKCGYKPFVYAIAPFVTTRVHEFAKLDVAAQQLPVTLVGVGAGYAYSIMSTTHHTAEDIAIMRALPNLRIYSPSDDTSAAAVADHIANNPAPTYVRLDRGGLESIYLTSGEPTIMVPYMGKSSKVAIITTGVMTSHAIAAAKEFDDVFVIDVCQIKPFDWHIISPMLTHCEGIITLEEHRLSGGLGSIVAECVADYDEALLMLRLAAEDRFVFELGGREVIQRDMRLDVPSVVKRIKSWREMYEV